jgi:hypothetical protein
LSSFPEYWKKKWVDLEKLSHDRDEQYIHIILNKNDNFIIKHDGKTSESDENIVMNNLERR